MAQSPLIECIVALAVFLALSASPVARANDCAKCDQYASLLPQYNLANNVLAIGSAALQTEGHMFAADAEIAAQFKRQVEQDTRIPAECREYLASKIRSAPKVALMAEGTIGSNGLGGRTTPFSVAGSYAAQMMRMYEALVSSYDPCSALRSSSASGKSAYISCLQAKAPAAYAKFSQAMASGSSAQISSQLAKLGFGNVQPGDVGVLRSFAAGINSGSQAGLAAWAARTSKTLGYTGLLASVQMMLWQANNMYSFKRDNNVGTAGQGVVSIDEVLASLKSGSVFMINAKLNLPNGSTDPAAALATFAPVCRDAAVLGAYALEQGGCKQSYAVGYRTAAGGHWDVWSQCPNDRFTTYILDWGNRATNKDVDGAQSLFQGTAGAISDYGMRYQIADGTGRTLASVPSGMGLFLDEVAGGKNTDWDPLARTNNSILAINAAPDNSGAVQVRTLVGNDGNGALYLGAASSAHWADTSHFPGEAGLFAGIQTHPGEVYGIKNNMDQAEVLYMQASQHAITPAIKLGQNASAVLDTHLTLAGQLTNVIGGPDASQKGSNLNADGDDRIGTEIRVDQKIGKTQLQYVVGGNVILALSDVRAQGQASDYTVVPLDLYMGARATHTVGGIKLFAQVMNVLDQIGDRLKAEAGVAGARIGGSVYFAGAATNATSLVEDNSIRRIGFNLSALPNNWLRLGVSGELPVEGDDPINNFRIYGSAAIVR